MKAIAIVALALAIGGLAACKSRETLHTPHASWERMMDQPKVDAYEPGAMRTPPPGTVPVDFDVDTAGGVADDGGYLDRLPVPVTRALLERGRARFDAVCATCHGVLADGDSVVAEKMSLRRPPNLNEPRYRALPPGQVYEFVTRGYGLMPSYASALSAEERWAVVGYLEALQIARGVRVAELPPPVRDELAKEAP